MSIDLTLPLDSRYNVYEFTLNSAIYKIQYLMSPNSKLLVKTISIEFTLRLTRKYNVYRAHSS